MALFGLIPEDERDPYKANTDDYHIGGVNVMEPVHNMRQGYLDKGSRAGIRAAGLDEWASGQGKAGERQDKYVFGARRERMRALDDLEDARGEQQRMGGQFEEFARGPEGPSAAERMLQRQSDAAFAQQMAMARSGRGPSGAALRNAQFQAGQTQGALAGQAAEMRAAEQARYRAERLQALSGAQGAYATGANMLNAAQAGYGGVQQADLQRLGMYNQQQLGLLGAADRQRMQDYQYDVLGKDLLEKQAGLLAQRHSTLAGAHGPGGPTGQTGQDLQSLAAMAGMAMMLSDTKEKREKAKAEGISETLLALGGDTGKSAQSGMKFGNAMTSAFQGDPSQVNAPAAAPPPPQPIAPGQYAGPEYGVPPQYAGAFGPPNAMGAQPAGYMPIQSDEREKFDLRPAQAYSYKYKDPNAPGAAPGAQVGPMAQDLEKTAAGRAAVTQTDPKMVDAGRLTLVNTGAISEQQRRIDELEERLAALGAKRGRAA